MKETKTLTSEIGIHHNELPLVNYLASSFMLADVCRCETQTNKLLALKCALKFCYIFEPLEPAVRMCIRHCSAAAESFSKYPKQTKLRCAIEEYVHNLRCECFRGVMNGSNLTR